MFDRYGCLLRRYIESSRKRLWHLLYLFLPHIPGVCLPKLKVSQYCWLRDSGPFAILLWISTWRKSSPQRFVRSEWVSPCLVNSPVWQCLIYLLVCCLGRSVLFRAELCWQHPQRPSSYCKLHQSAPIGFVNIGWKYYFVIIVWTAFYILGIFPIFPSLFDELSLTYHSCRSLLQCSQQIKQIKSKLIFDLIWRSRSVIWI